MNNCTYSCYNNAQNFAFANHLETPIKPGTVILTCKPFAYTLGFKFADTRCDTCFKTGESVSESHGHPLLRCSGCHLVRYCDRDCQRVGWQDGHKWECKGFKVYARIPASFARMLLRVITKLNIVKDQYDDVTPKLRRRFKDLVSHYSDVKADKERMEQIFTMSKVVKSILDLQSDVKMPNESEIIGICGRLYVNTFNILDYEGLALGTGLYLGASIFDHSCEPMAVANFESNVITIRSIKEIPAGFSVLKITICYKETIRPSNIRIHELRKMYYFECQCERCYVKVGDLCMTSVKCPNRTKNCKAEVNLSVDEKCSGCNVEFDADFVKDITEAEEMAKLRWGEMSDVAYMDVCEACLRVMRSLNFSETNWLMVCMASGAFDASVDRQYWEKAYQYGQLTIKGYRVHLSEIHPMLGIILLKMAKLACYLGKEEEAKSFVTEAKKILDITHGPNHPSILENIFPLVQQLTASSKHINGRNGFL